MSFTQHELGTGTNDIIHDTYRYKVMVVDDSSIARKLIKKYAKDINANVICEAANAEEAFNQYVEFEPDVVTMDISMPGGSGLQAVKKIINFDPSAKILMITSHGEEEMVIDALESGAKGFILKPVTKEKLEDQFNKVKHDPYKMFKSVHFFDNLNEKNMKQLKKFTARSEYLVFLAENSQELFPILKDMHFDCVGGVFPEIIYEGQVYHEGFLILELSKEANYKFIKDISEPIEESLKLLLKNKRTILTIADALCKNTEPFLDNLSTMLNPYSTMIGCGSGARNMEQSASIFTPKGIFKDAAIIFYSHEPITVGLAHGWKKLEGPFEVTKAKLNTLVEVDDERNAFDIYQKILHDRKGLQIKDSNFFEIAKKFPIGIEKENQMVIRGIIKKTNDGLYTLGDFNLRSHINIMEWDNEGCLLAANKAVLEATQELQSADMRFAFIFEGIERRHYENNDELISQDLLVIKERLKNIPQCGAVSLMEFSNKNSHDALIHNSSVLIGVIS